MKLKHNLLFAALLIPTANAAVINVFGNRNNSLPAAPTYTNNNYMKASFSSTNEGEDGGLGTNIYVVHDDANLDGDNNPKTVKWTSDNTYFVRDKLFIPRGTTLTIEPGTKVYFSTNDNGSTDRTDDAVGAITACRGAMLIADGTANAPIVFTSDREYEIATGLDSPIDGDITVNTTPLTSSDAGLWGGIVMLGQAFVSFVNDQGANTPTVQIEGFAPSASLSFDGDGIPDATQYGISGNKFLRNDNDNSGIVRYVSIRHGGYEFSSGREINGLTLGGVGRGTTIEFVEVYANQDDGIEFFGGTVNTRNIVMAFNQDDSFDMDEAYNGVNQFWFGIQNPGAADGGFEADGVGNNSAGYARADLRNESSNPKIYNATIIGPGRSNTLSLLPVTSGTVNWEKGNHAMIIEDRFAGEIYNSVFDDFSGDLIRFVDAGVPNLLDPNLAIASTGIKFAFRNNTIGRFGNTAQVQIEVSTVSFSPSTNTAPTGNGNLAITVTGLPVTPINLTTAINTSMNRAAVVAAVRDALNANANFSAHYTAATGASAGQIVLTSLVAGTSAPNINVAITASLGVAAQASSSVLQSASNSSVTTTNALTYITNASGADLNFVFDSIGGPIDGNSAQNTNPMFTTYTRNGSSFLTAINPIPQSGSPLLTSSVISGAPVAANYRGAFGPSGNWAAGWTKLSQSGVLQGAAPAPAIVDADGDGISDALEATTELTALGFSVGVNNVTTHGGVPGTNRFASLYTSTSIQNLRGTGLIIGPVTPGGNAQITLPLFRSDNLTTWTAAGNATATVATPVGKQFFRIDLSSGTPNP